MPTRSEKDEYPASTQIKTFLKRSQHEWFKIFLDLSRDASGRNVFLLLADNLFLKNYCFQENPLPFKVGFHMIADDRGSQIAESPAIVCDHMKAHF